MTPEPINHADLNATRGSISITVGVKRTVLQTVEHMGLSVTSKMPTMHVLVENVGLSAIPTTTSITMKTPLSPEPDDGGLDELLFESLFCINLLNLSFLFMVRHPF